jgi:hypothetical protein
MKKIDEEIRQTNPGLARPLNLKFVGVI